VAERIPLFPLSAVLFPGLFFPLHIFEQRYRDMIRDLLDRDEPREFGVVLIRQGREVGEDGVKALHPTGCIADLRGIEPYPDGRSDIVTVGGRRFEFYDLDRSASYLQADVEFLGEPVGDDAASQAFAVTHAFASYRAILSGEAATSVDLPDDPLVLSYAVAAALVIGAGEKQQLLEAPDATSRLRQEHELLQRENMLLRMIPSLPALDLTQTGTSPN
jgi:uncharacterized protein